MLGYGLGHARFVAALFLIVLVMFLLINVGSVWAQSFNPNPPIAGQSFTISGVCSSAPCVVIVIFQTGLGCGSGVTVATLGPFNGMTGGPGPYSATVPAQPPGAYSTLTAGGESCVFFTITPAPPTISSPAEYQSPIGGEMLAINRVQVILPWVALIILLGTVSIWMLVVKRRR
jgi:hypothetical protein